MVPIVIYRFNAIPIKIPMIIFIEIERTFLNLQGTKKPHNSKNNLKNRNNAGGITLFYFKLYYHALVIKKYVTGTEMDT